MIFRRKAEHRAVRMETPGPGWGDDMRRIEAKCEMQGGGGLDPPDHVVAKRA